MCIDQVFVFFFYIPPFLLFVYLCLVFWASFPCPSHSALFLFLIPAIGSHIYTHSFHSHHSPYFFIRILISFILLFIYFFNFNSSAQTKFNMIFFKSGCDRISAFFLSYSTGNLFSMLLSSLSLGRLILRRKQKMQTNDSSIITEMEYHKFIKYFCYFLCFVCAEYST